MTKKIDKEFKLPKDIADYLNTFEPVTEESLAALGAANRKLNKCPRHQADLAGGHFTCKVWEILKRKKISQKKLDKKLKYAPGTIKSVLWIPDERDLTLRQIWEISYAVGLKPNLTFTLF